MDRRIRATRNHVHVDRRPRRRRHGDTAELIVRRHLLALGWTVLGTNVTVGKDELDIVAVEPGDARCVVFVEVRSNVTGQYGAPEESMVAGKLRRTYRAAWGLVRTGALPDGRLLPRLPWRVDVLIVEQYPTIGRAEGGPTIRHLRAVEPA